MESAVHPNGAGIGDRPTGLSPGIIAAEINGRKPYFLDAAALAAANLLPHKRGALFLREFGLLPDNKLGDELRRKLGIGRVPGNKVGIGSTAFTTAQCDGHFDTELGQVVPAHLQIEFGVQVGGGLLLSAPCCEGLIPVFSGKTHFTQEFAVLPGHPIWGYAWMTTLLLDQDDMWCGEATGVLMVYDTVVMTMNTRFGLLTVKQFQKTVKAADTMARKATRPPRGPEPQRRPATLAEAFFADMVAPTTGG